MDERTRKVKGQAGRALFAAETQRSAERKALAKLPELAQRAALAALHIEKASLAHVIKGIELARREGRWVDCWHEPPSCIDHYLLAIRCCVGRARPDPTGTGASKGAPGLWPSQGRSGQSCVVLLLVRGMIEPFGSVRAVRFVADRRVVCERRPFVLYVNHRFGQPERPGTACLQRFVSRTVKVGFARGCPA